MSPIVWELLLIGVLLVGNGVLAMSELAIVSARRGLLEQQAAAGNRGAQAALQLLDDPGRFLSTVQIGITSVGIVAGAFGGATLSDELTDWLAMVPVLAPYREPLSFGIVVLGITYLSLIVGELVPKQLALAHAEAISVRIARPMRALAWIGGPLVWLLSASTAAALRLIRAAPREATTVSLDEIRLLVRQGALAGTLDPLEREVVEEALRLRERRVGAVMTPRPRVRWLNAAGSEAALWREIMSAPHAELPVCDGALDAVLGTVPVRLLLERRIRGETLDLASLPLNPPRFVLDQQPILHLLEAFGGSGSGIAIVTDERGSVVGVLSPTDLLEAFLGDAVSFGKRAQHRPAARPDGAWLLEGLAPLDVLRSTLGVRHVPDHPSYRTLGGFVFATLGRVPEVGDAVSWEDWEFEVVAMAGHRVDKLVARPRVATPLSEMAP